MDHEITLDIAGARVTVPRLTLSRLWLDECLRAASGQFVTAPTTFPKLEVGERYAGLIVSAARRKHHHIVLLPEENPKKASWDDSMAWAQSRGADLPDRVEGALLCFTLRDEFQGAAYWLNEQLASDPDYAWFQGFDYGGQNYYAKDTSCRARAVRRVDL